MKLQARLLSDEERLRVHNQSIRALEEIGTKVPSERALSLLEKHGAKIDWDEQVAYINEKMVCDALDKAPKEFTLGAVDPKYDLKLPTRDSIYNLDGSGIWTIDYETGKRRRSTTEDIINAVRIFDEIEIGNAVWAPVSPSEEDGPADAESIMDMGYLFKYYRKHVQDEVTDPVEVPYMIGILKAILGSIEEVKKRKIYSVCYCTIAPLAHEKYMLEATLDISHYDVPVLAFPMPAAGSTGPASLFSNLVLSNAETLSIFVLLQCESPGVPILFGNAAGITNRRSGVLLEGAVESTLTNTAMVEMAEYYGGFPTEMAGCLTDAKEPGRQAAIEKTLSTLPFEMSGADIVQGIGMLEASMTLSFEQILIDEEIALLCKRMSRGINVSDETDFYEDMKAVGHSGHFLKQKNTKHTFRSGSEYFNPYLMDRDSYEEWERIGSPDMYKNAHKRVKDILNSEPKNYLPYNTEKEIDEIIKEAKRIYSE